MMKFLLEQFLLSKTDVHRMIFLSFFCLCSICLLASYNITENHNTTKGEKSKIDTNTQTYNSLVITDDIASENSRGSKEQKLLYREIQNNTNNTDLNYRLKPKDVITKSVAIVNNSHGEDVSFLYQTVHTATINWVRC